MPEPEKINDLAEQIVCGIATAVLGVSGAIGPEEIMRAAQNLGLQRRGSGGAALALFCEQFLMARKNYNYEIESNGERWVLATLASFHPAVAFDVGANAGDWTAAALAELPGAHVHAFEIMDATYVSLAGRFGGNARVTVNSFGLSDRDGTIPMFDFNASNKLASHVPYPHGPYQRTECPVRTGDGYMREHAIERIDFLKLDVEGAEHLVLGGLSSALDSGKIDVIQFEYGMTSILTHFLLMDFYALLESKGYVVGKIYPDHVEFRPYGFTDEDFRGPNYLAVLKRRSDLIDALR